MCISFMQVLHHLCKGHQHPWILVSMGSTGPVPCRYCRTTAEQYMLILEFWSMLKELLINSDLGYGVGPH
jgi:hypothetical protein